MALSRQETALADRRSNQRLRTRTALLRAAAELVKDGRPPSMPEAAERALVSVATAYRYFTTAEELWWEASTAFAELEPRLADAERLIEAAGDDPFDRLEALIRAINFYMVENQAPFRRLARSALDQWFASRDDPRKQGTPVREGRRNRHIDLVLAPLRDHIPKKDLERVAAALGVVVGTDAMLALVDSVGLDEQKAKKAMLDSGRWILTGALSELRAPEVARDLRR